MIMTQECTAARLTPPALNISPDFQKFGFEDNWVGGGGGGAGDRL